MSRLKSIAHAIKTRIEEIPELLGKVVVYDSSSVEAEFDQRMGKAKGKVVIVRLLTGTNTSKQKTKARFSGKYTVSLFTSPVLNAKDAKDNDALMDEIIELLHGWWPASIPSSGSIWCSTDLLTFPDDPQFDVTVLTLDAPKQD